MRETMQNVKQEIVLNETSVKESDLSSLTKQICNAFVLSSNDKWSLLVKFNSRFLDRENIPLSVSSFYHEVLSVLLDALKINLFSNTSEENIFYKFFLHGPPEETFLVVVRKLNCTFEGYKQDAIINILKKFLEKGNLEILIYNQCLSEGKSDPEYITRSLIWNDLITLLVSLPERIANKKRIFNQNIFQTDNYMKLLITAVFKAFNLIHNRLVHERNSTIEFPSLLLSKLCILGYSEHVTTHLSIPMLQMSVNDMVYRRICQNLTMKIQTHALLPFLTTSFLSTEWYGYCDYFLGDLGLNEKFKIILATKLIFCKYFDRPLILQNIIGYYASNENRQSIFWDILGNLLKVWADANLLKHQSKEQQIYLASALLICAGWIKNLKPDERTNGLVGKALEGVSLRIHQSEEFVRNLSIVVADKLVPAMCPDGPEMNFEELRDSELYKELESLVTIPTEPKKHILSADTSPTTSDKTNNKLPRHGTSIASDKTLNPETSENVSDDDDLEAYSTCNDLPSKSRKRPFYLRDCLQGLLGEENDQELFEQCLRCSEQLIWDRGETIHEMSLEMAKVLLHLENKHYMDDFEELRHKSMVALTVNSPKLVGEYYATEFYEKDYTIRHRLDILQVLRDASMELSKPEAATNKATKENSSPQTENSKSFVEKRLAQKTRYKTNIQKKETKESENKFSLVAGNFFFPLLAKYDRFNPQMKLLDSDSFVLSRLVYTLGVIMRCSLYTPISMRMGEALLEFISCVRDHEDVSVRKACLFALGATYTTIPGYICSSLTLQLQSDKEWLEETIKKDPDAECRERARQMNNVLVGIMQEEMPILKELRDMFRKS